MTWFRVGGAGVPATLRNAMNAVFNKKFGTTGQNYPPKQWPDEVNLLGPLPERTASGQIVNITDGAELVPVKSWVVAMGASLSGYSSIECFAEDSEQAQYYDETVSIGQTIFGGNADIINGTGTNNCTKRDLRGDGFTWVLNTTDASFPFFTIGANAPGKASNKNFVCDGYVNRGNYRSNLADGEIGVFNNTSGINRFCIRDDSCTTLDQFLEKITNYKIVYEVNNTTTFSFTPISPIPQTKNTCDLWSDSGDSSVTYRADIDLLLSSLSGSRGLMMASRPVTQLVGEESDPDQVNELVENDEDDIREQLNEVVENDETEQEGENDAR